MDLKELERQLTQETYWEMCTSCYGQTGDMCMQCLGAGVFTDRKSLTHRQQLELVRYAQGLEALIKEGKLCLCS